MRDWKRTAVGDGFQAPATPDFAEMRNWSFPQAQIGMLL
jgi:hypothetical protein